MTGKWRTMDFVARPRSYPQIAAERLEDLLMRCERWQRRWRNRARLAKHRQQTLQCRLVAGLDGLLPGSVPEVLLDHTFIEIRQLRAAARNPAHEIAEQAEGPPCALVREPVLGETCRVKLDELSVPSTLQAPEQPAFA